MPEGRIAVTGSLQDVRGRVTRLETLREADRAQTAAEITRFKLHSPAAGDAVFYFCDLFGILVHTSK